MMWVVLLLLVVHCVVLYTTQPNTYTLVHFITFLSLLWCTPKSLPVVDAQYPKHHQFICFPYGVSHQKRHTSQIFSALHLGAVGRVANPRSPQISPPFFGKTHILPDNN